MELNVVQTRIFSKSSESSSLTSKNLSSELQNSSGKFTTQATLTPEIAIQILKSEPDRDELIKVLQWLLPPHRNLLSSPPRISSAVNDFKFNRSSPQVGQIINILVNDILPAHWPLPRHDSEPDKHEEKLRFLFVECLRSVPGIHTLIVNLRRILNRAHEPRSPRDTNGAAQKSGQRLALLVEVIENVLRGDEFLAGIWRDIHLTVTTSTSDSSLDTDDEDHGVSAMDKQMVSLLWNDFLAIVKGDKIISAVAEAATAGAGQEKCTGSWVGNGEKYSEWLGRNVWFMAAQGGEEEVKAAARVLGSGLSLGYKDAVIQAAFADLMAADEEAVDKSKSLLGCLAGQAQRTVLYAIVRMMDRRYLVSIGRQMKDVSENMLGAVASLLSKMIDGAAVRKNFMIDWLVSLSPEAVLQSHMAHRAVVLVLSTDQESLKTALSRALELFAQDIFIKHTPIFQQEINAQILLLLTGYVFRGSDLDLVKISKSSLYLNSISNHLASTSPRAHFLGMVVGNAVSQLIDSKDKQLNFSSTEMDGADGQWYRELTKVQDFFKPVADLSQASSPRTNSNPKKVRDVTSTSEKKLKSSLPVKGSSKIIAIEELDDASSEESDIPTYAKPDSDPEESDDNAELVQKKKPMAPVYIRDLLAGLRDLEDYDRHRLALSSAPSLIRRKAAFGTEITDNIDDLATLLTGLNDKYEMDSFQRWRLQGMIALLVTNPKRMGPWFAQAYYNGECSMSQRASILTALGLGAREIAGLGNEDEAMTGSSPEVQFPSKKLPTSLHNHYTSLSGPSLEAPVTTKSTKSSSTTLSPTPIDTLAKNLSQSLLRPLAAQAADALTGPDALKIRTFSSRLAVRSRTPAPSSNPLAKILADAFFFPLVGRWSSNNIITSPSSSREAAGTITASPFLLSHLLRTLAIILYASGTTSPDLPRLTTEFWHLLLSVRSLAVELPVLEAVLFALLTLLEVNIARDDRRVAAEHAQELLETQAWVEGLFEARIGGSGTGEDESVRMVAAGVLIRCREIVERWQRVLMGDLIEYT